MFGLRRTYLIILIYSECRKSSQEQVIFVISKEMLDMLNKLVARELQFSIQYRWQQIMMKGVEGATVEKVFREMAIENIENATKLAERLVYLAGVLPSTFDATHVAHGLDDMLKENVQFEEEIIDMLKQAIQMATKEFDYTTRRLLEDVLMVEEKHLDKISKLLVGMTKPFTQLKLDSG
jgi:bacterioferritin